MGKKAAFGGVLVRADGKILLRRPTGDFGGYVWTFAKGHPEHGASPEETAHREVLEETGYHAEIIGKVPGRFVGDTTVTEFYLMCPIGDPAPCGSETAEIRWVGFEDAVLLIELTTTVTGRERDLEVLNQAKKALESLPHNH